MNSGNDIVDVEFETIAANGRSANPKPARTEIPTPQNEPSDDEQLSVFGNKPTHPEAKPMPLPLFTFVAAICVVGAFLVSGGYKFLTTPQTSQTETARTAEIAADNPLKLEEITSNILERGAGRVLNIRATVHNSDKIAQTIPPIMVHLGDNSATQRMFRIARGEILNPGEKLVFTSSMPIGNAAGDNPQLSFAQ